MSNEHQTRTELLMAAAQARGAMAGLQELLLLLAERGALNQEDVARVFQVMDVEMTRFIEDILPGPARQSH